MAWIESYLKIGGGGSEMYENITDETPSSTKTYTVSEDGLYCINSGIRGKQEWYTAAKSAPVHKKNDVTLDSTNSVTYTQGTTKAIFGVGSQQSAGSYYAIYRTTFVDCVVGDVLTSSSANWGKILKVMEA